ncbi:MAG: hypothetical protein CMC88_03055 [Flavobacteriaceae bacterium]|nr:hypothetical protein [Flavobacteriaceae bacterium]|tara:strand:- start:19260 stop:19769 length:510 start_codon:yes stop_codon:yes gene_type:complete
MIKRIKFLFLSLRLSKELKNSNRKIKIVSKKKLSVGLLIDSKFDLNDSFILMLAMKLELSKDRFDITVFNNNNFNNFKVNLISIEDVGLFGKLPLNIKKFLNRRFDLLFNLHYNNPLLALLSSISKANFRIGLIQADKRLNDLIINLSPENPKFIDESAKYLNKIFFKK